MSPRLLPSPRGRDTNPLRSSPGPRLSQVIGLLQDGEARAGGSGVGAGRARGARGCPGARGRFRPGGRERRLGPETAQLGGGPREPGRGCILGPLAQPSRRLLEADSSDGSHTNSLPPRQTSHAQTRTARHPVSPTHPSQRTDRADSPVSLHRDTCGTRTSRLAYTSHTRQAPAALAGTPPHIGGPPRSRPSPRTRTPLTHAAHTHHTTVLTHAAPLIRTPFTHASSLHTHKCYTRSPPLTPVAPLPHPPARSRWCLGAAPFPRRANKRPLLPAGPKKGRLSGVSGGRGVPAGGPTLWPCPTWRPRGGQRGAAGSPPCGKPHSARQPQGAALFQYPSSTPNTNKITPLNYTRAWSWPPPPAPTACL